MAVLADIEFLLPGTGRLFTYAHEAPPGAEPETARFLSQRIEIRDLRGGEAVFTLDENGGTLGHWPTRVRRFDEEADVRERYYPESAEIIQDALGADAVVVFDHNVRHGGAPAPRAGHAVGRPVRHAHTDYTPGSALERLRRELGPRAEMGLSRFQQVNLWRPIRGPVRDAPLALCDGASVAPHALRAVALRYPERTGEICYLVHEPGQRWVFASDMTVDEAWLFKNFDSASPGPGRVAPHSAFTDPRQRHVAPRESIEVRALAIFW